MDFKRKGPSVLMTLLSDVRQGEEECDKPKRKELLEKFRQIQNRLNRRQGINPRLKAKKEREKEDVVLV